MFCIRNYSTSSHLQSIRGPPNQWNALPKHETAKHPKEKSRDSTTLSHSSSTRNTHMAGFVDCLYLSRLAISPFIIGSVSACFCPVGCPTTFHHTYHGSSLEAQHTSLPPIQGQPPCTPPAASSWIQMPSSACPWHERSSRPYSHNGRPSLSAA
jgi:hypothetical protein